jgi:sugar diacid utilization regulator
LVAYKGSVLVAVRVKSCVCRATEHDKETKTFLKRKAHYETVKPKRKPNKKQLFGETFRLPVLLQTPVLRSQSEDLLKILSMSKAVATPNLTMA